MSSEHEEEDLEKLAELLDRRERGDVPAGTAAPGPGAPGPAPVVTGPSGQARASAEPPDGMPAPAHPLDQGQVSAESPERGQAAAVPRAGAGSYTFAEVCSLLNLSPYTLRGLLADYGDVLGVAGAAQEEAPAGKRRLSEWSFRLLREAVTLRNAGMSREEIRDRLRALAEAAVGLAVVPGYQGPGGSGHLVRYVDRATARDLLLIEKVEQLSEQLARSEQKRVEDRDRLLVALLRTQQEIQQLRYELVARGTRRDRKRRGIWARLFGQ